MLLKDYWFKELYLGLKVAASLNRTESFIKTIEVHHGRVSTLFGDVDLMFIPHLNQTLPSLGFHVPSVPDCLMLPLSCLVVEFN